MATPIQRYVDDLTEQVCRVINECSPTQATIVLTAVLSTALQELPPELRNAFLPSIIELLSETPAPGVH